MKPVVFQSEFGSVYSFNPHSLHANGSLQLNKMTEMQIDEPMTMDERNDIKDRKLILNQRREALLMARSKLKQDVTLCITNNGNTNIDIIGEKSVIDRKLREIKYNKSKKEFDQFKKSLVYNVVKDGKCDLNEEMQKKLTSFINFRNLFNYTQNDDINAYCSEYDNYYVFLFRLRSSLNPLYYIVIRKNVLK